MYPSRDAREAEIRLGGTLPARALRNLFDHAAVHLNVEWRDLSDEGWDVEVADMDDRPIPARETAWVRAREVWVHAVDLGNGGSYGDVPPDVLDALISEVTTEWAQREEGVRLTLRPTDRSRSIPIGGGGTTVSGRTAELARWLTGRGARGLECSADALPTLPPWRHGRLGA